MNRTALYPIHKKMGAKLVEFAGWEMPVKYEGVRQEHSSVRESAGLFDISHMGEFEIIGRDALEFCQWITTNDVSKLDQYQAQYTLLCNHEGGIVDDLIIYKLSGDRIFMCVNASNTAKDFEWVQNAVEDFKVEVLNRSPEFSLLAIQGQRAEKILSATLGVELNRLKRFYCISGDWNGISLLIARTGYTGEDGFEVFLPWNKAEELWNAVMEIGKAHRMKPCGLGARDTLRIEASFSLYGHEIDENTNPFAAGLGRYVKMDKTEFIGKNAIRKELENGLRKKLFGFEMTDRGIPRHGYHIYLDDSIGGKVTSGTLSPTLGKPIGMGYIEVEVETGDEIEVEIHGKRRKGRIVSTPFYKN